MVANRVLRQAAFYFVLLQVAGLSAADAPRTITSDVEVHFKKYVRTRGALVRLGDVATITAADDDVRARLANVELFPAPSPGNARLTSGREIQGLLRLKQVDVTGVAFLGSTLTRVTAASQPVREAASRPVAAGDASEATLVLVAKRELARGDIVGDFDVELSAVEVRRGVTPVHQRSDVIGQEVTRSIRMGEVIDSRKLAEPVLVKRRELVNVTARAAGVSVQTHARALEDGVKGQLIMLETPDKKRYAARVSGAGEVTLDVGTVAARGTSGVRVSKPVDRSRRLRR